MGPAGILAGSIEFENLSGGQAKTVSIGRALALKPDLLILDEPLEKLTPMIVERLIVITAIIFIEGIEKCYLTDSQH